MTRHQSIPAYFAGKRDLRIDLLRGAAIAAMVVDHVGGEQSWLYGLTGGNRFFVSAAEAFVFMAGLVAGIVYGGVAARDGAGQAILKMLRRAGVLYVWTVMLTLALPLLSEALGLNWGNPLAEATPAQFVVGAITLHRSYHFVDALLLYVLLFSSGGLALALMNEGRTFPVLALSWSLWLGWQVFPTYATVPWPIEGMDVFQPAAWQALFMTGLAIGVHRRTIERSLGHLPLAAYAGSGALFLAAAVVFNQHEQQALLGFAPGVDAQTLANWLFSKADLRAGRLVAFAFAGAFAFSALSLAWKSAEASIGWLLIPLGQHSLLAYALHIGVVAWLSKLAAVVFPDGLGAEQNTLLQLTGVFVVWALVQGIVSGREWLRQMRGASGQRPLLLQPVHVPIAGLRTRDAA
ncbi:MAG TPA: OpgC domain-containing protein [Chloroflexota bacterium]